MKKLICGDACAAPCARTMCAPAATVIAAAIAQVICFTRFLLVGSTVQGTRTVSQPAFYLLPFAFRLQPSAVRRLPAAGCRLPSAGYDPRMTPDEFRRHGHAVVD